ncbi:MAG: Gfo/Idh/MocA family oxidoreductase, partial [Planctomycetes bacterium]|nr:Gfo/Idh/MocA family oxidoreductase [Planctomycetota bacterium]
TSIAECDQMIAAAEKAGVKLMVAHSRRFFPLVKQAKQLLDDGAIGRILMLRQLFSHNARSFGTKEGHWMSDPRLSMGFFLGYGCHQLDMTLHLVGSRVRAVMARFGNYWADTPIENCGALFLDFESGAYSTFMEICSMPNELKAWPPFPDYHEVNELIGERGLMLLRPYQRLLLRNGKEGDDWKTIAELPPREADNPTIFLREEVEALADAVAGGTVPPVTAAEGRHCVEVIQAAYESSRTGKAVYLPL